MRKILLSLLVIAMALGLVGAGASGAFFSDTEITSSTANSGIIDINLSGDTGTAEAPFVIEDLKPCDTGWVHLTVTNDPEGNEGPIYLHLDVTSEYSNGCTEPEQANDGCNVNNIADWMWVDIYVDDVCLLSDGVITLGDLDCSWIPVGWLAKDGGTMDIDLSFHLKAETDNKYQSDGVAFNIEVEMRDHNAPPPEGVILLENKDANWNVIEDNTWGVAKYVVDDLNLFVMAVGLTPNTNYQICLTSPEDADWYPLTQSERESMASALASGQYVTPPAVVNDPEYNLHERGYSNGGPTLSATYSAGNQGVFTTSQSGVTPRIITSDANGVIVESVSFPLPAGQYEYIKITVKEDFGLYKPILMEATQPLTFNIP